jgi:hypothetical protein
MTQPKPICDPMLVGGQWDENLVVFILTREIHTLRLKYSDHGVGLTAEGYGVPWSDSLRSKRCTDGRSQDDHPLAIILAAEEPAALKHERAHAQVFGCRAEQTYARRPVVATYRRLTGNDRNDSGSCGESLLYNFSIFRQE